MYLKGCLLGETSSTDLSANRDVAVIVTKRHPPWADEFSRDAVSWDGATAGRAFVCPSAGSPYKRQ